MSHCMLAPWPGPISHSASHGSRQSSLAGPGRGGALGTPGEAPSSAAASAASCSFLASARRAVSANAASTPAPACHEAATLTPASGRRAAQRRLLIWRPDTRVRFLACRPSASLGGPNAANRVSGWGCAVTSHQARPPLQRRHAAAVLLVLHSTDAGSTVPAQAAVYLMAPMWPWRAGGTPVSAETSKYAAPTAAATPRDSAAGTARAEPRSALFPSTVRTMCGPTCALDGQPVTHERHAGSSKQPCAGQSKERVG